MDCCLGGPRQAKEFDKNAGLDSAQIATLLTNNQVGIVVLVIFQVILAALWLAMSLVQGFSLYDGTGGHAHPVSHFGWWIIAELIVICIGVAAPYFTLAANKSKKLEFHVNRARNYLVFYMAMLGIGILFNTVHASLSIVEATHCTSSFCRGFNVIDPINAPLLGQLPRTSGFIIVFIIMLFVDIFFIQLALFYRAWVYRTHLWYAVGSSRKIFDVETGPETQEANDDEEDGEVTPDTNVDKQSTPTAPPLSVSPSPPTPNANANEKEDSVVEARVANIKGVITPMMRKAQTLQSRYGMKKEK
jgi:hypothetical protein